MKLSKLLIPDKHKTIDELARSNRDWLLVMVVMALAAIIVSVLVSALARAIEPPVPTTRGLVSAGEMEYR